MNMLCSASQNCSTLIDSKSSLYTCHLHRLIAQDLACLINQSSVTSIFFCLLQEMLYKHTSLSRNVGDLKSNLEMRSFADKASGRSFLFPRTSKGIPAREGLESKSWSSWRAASIPSRSAASTTKTMACTPLQYLSHMLLNRACPPRSHILIVTPPLLTFRILKPTVGIMSSWNEPLDRALTRDVLPAFCNPIRDNSISFVKKRLRSQSKMLCHQENIIIRYALVRDED